MKVVAVQCGKCAGQGFVKKAGGWWRANGRCFACQGTGLINENEAVMRKVAIDEIAVHIRQVDYSLSIGNKPTAMSRLNKLVQVMDKLVYCPDDVRKRAEAAIAARRAAP